MFNQIKRIMNKKTTYGVGEPIANSREAEKMLHNRLYRLDHEEVWVIYLTSVNTVIGKEMVSKGTLSRTSIDPRTILRQVLLRNAASIIVLHNHPSGSSKPSKEDMIFTGMLRNACRTLDIELVDHIILGADEFFSFSHQLPQKYA